MLLKAWNLFDIRHCVNTSSNYKAFYFLKEEILSGHSKKDKTKILMTNGSLMKVESIA